MEALRKPQIIAHIEKSFDFSVFDTRWIPSSAKFVVLGSRPNTKGTLKIFELNTNADVDLINECERNSSFRCGTFGASTMRNNHMAIGDFDGNLEILDLQRSDLPSIYSVKAHDGIVNCLDGIGGGNTLKCGAPEIVTAGKDGNVKVWDPRQKNEPVLCVSGVSEADGGTGSRDCWAVTFGNSYNTDERIVCSGYDNGDLKLFDLRTGSLRWETNVKNGICGIEFDRKDIEMNKMVVTTLEGGLFVYDMRTQHPTKGFSMISEKDAGRSLGTNGVISGGRSTVWCVRHVPQNRDLFVTCGGTGSLRLWNYEYPAKRFKECGDGHTQGICGDLKMLQATTLSSQPVHCFDWSPDHLGLAVCGAFDQTVRVLITTKLNLFQKHIITLKIFNFLMHTFLLFWFICCVTSYINVSHLTYI